jgi:hypothetical protein
MIEVGQRWREKSTGRVIVILQVEVHGTGPAWHYEDECPCRQRYCDVADFAIWNRFELEQPS